MIKKKERSKTSESEEHQSQLKVEDRRSSARIETEDDKNKVVGEDVSLDKKETDTKLEKELKKKLEELEEKEKQYIDRLQRLQAEFENYRKRVDRERIESWANAKGDLVLKLLYILDDFNRVSSMEAKDNHAKDVIEGMQLVEKNLHEILKEEGLEEIDALGSEFDPNYHEALLTVETDDPQKDNIVSEILIKGYMFQEKLLRPSRVKVLRYVSKDENTGNS